MRDVNSIIESVAIVAENVNTEAIRQPMLFIEAAQYRVATMRVRARAKAELEVFEAEFSFKVRKAGQGGERITEGHVKARLVRHPKRQRLQAVLDRAEEQEELGRLILEAYRHRRDALKIIAEGQIAEGIKESSEIEKAEQHRRLSLEARKLHSRRARAAED